MASIYPVQFLELLVMRPAYWACIVLETTGLTHFCWVLAFLFARLFRMKEEQFEIVVEGKEEKRNGGGQNNIKISSVGYNNEAMVM